MAYLDPNAFNCKKCGRAEQPFRWGLHSSDSGLEPGYCFQCSHWARIKLEGNILVHHSLVFSVYEDYAPIKTGQDEGLWEFHLFTGEILVAARVSIRGALPPVWFGEFPNTVSKVFTNIKIPWNQATFKEIPESASGLGFFRSVPVVTLERAEVKGPLVQPTLF